MASGCTASPRRAAWISAFPCTYGSKRPIREIVLRGLSLKRAQKLFGLATTELMYECFPVTDSVARTLQTFSPDPLDVTRHDYFLERRAADDL